MTTQDADVLIAGAGPTGLMLAGELALAGVDVAIIERRDSQELAGSRAGGLHSRSIEILDQRGIADRSSRGKGGERRAILRRRFGYQRLSHPASLLARALAKPHRAHPGRLGRRARRDDPSRTRGDRFRAGRHRRRRRALRRPVAAGTVSRRMRRRAQPDPQDRRHRIPRVGSDREQPDRRGRTHRTAGMGRPPGRHRHPWHRQGGVRDPRRRDCLRR